MKAVVISAMKPVAWESKAGRKGFTQTVLVALEDGRKLTGSIFGMTEALANEEITEFFREARLKDELWGELSEIVKNGKTKTVFNKSYDAGIGFVWDSALTGQELAETVDNFVNKTPKKEVVPADQASASKMARIRV